MQLADHPFELLRAQRAAFNALAAAATSGSLIRTDYWHLSDYRTAPRPLFGATAKAHAYTAHGLTGGGTTGSGSSCPPRVEERSTVSKDKCRELGHTKETSAISSDRVQSATGGGVTLKELALE
jgi:hypothetical protein